MKQVLYKFNKAVNQGVFNQEKVDKKTVNDERNYRRTTIDGTYHFRILCRSFCYIFKS